jgi:methionyl-tRNA formyltransferase
MTDVSPSAESTGPGHRRPLRIALFTLESTASAQAVLAFAQARAESIVLVGLSDPYRPKAGGMLGQTWRHIRRSGPRFLPYLFVNFTLPGLAAMVRATTGSRRGIRTFAVTAGIPVKVICDVNGPECSAAIRAAKANLIVSFHFDQIFSPATLACAPLGGINVHPSLLPRHRGPVPTFWALQDGGETGATVHRLAEAIDTGEILDQRVVPLPRGVSASGAARHLHLAAVAALLAVIEGIENGTAQGRQEPVLPYCGFPSPAQIKTAGKAGVDLVNASDWSAAWTAPVDG